MSWWSDRDFRPSTTKKVEKILDIIAEIAKAEYERGKEDEKRWWSGHCANCTDEDRTQGEWVSKGKRIYRCSNCGNYLDFDGVNAGRGDANFCPNCGCDMRKGTNDE